MSGTEEVTEEAIAEVFSSILARGRVADFDLLQKSMSSEEIVEIVLLIEDGDLGQVHHRLNRERERIFDALVKTFVTDDWRAAYVISDFTMLKRTLRGLFQKYEGSSCCADKAGAVIRKAYRHFRYDDPISFEKMMVSDHSFACPEKILTTEAEIVELIEAMAWMRSGTPFKFAEIIQKMEAEHAPEAVNRPGI